MNFPKTQVRIQYDFVLEKNTKFAQFLRSKDFKKSKISLIHYLI